MKKQIQFFSGIAVWLFLGFGSVKCRAQGQEMQQLLLNIEKLTQLKSILSDMKTGYQIYQQGYGTIASLAKGNFSLHDVYLNGLLQINPAVRNYGRVALIISQEASLLTEYKSAFRRFSQSGSFRPEELSYISQVYARLVRQSLDDLNELTSVLTAGKLRMSDHERMTAIDRVYAQSTDKLQFLRYFNRQGSILSLQRSKDRQDAAVLKQLYGVNHDQP
ncbi:TerB family tellurite resistance protein [Mucilaginibacter segetis]|uniref:TerB family tellurite resistance protein n=1 Tax=Mucilaginibacter segetis TaxID=2793071 RepID=A0A934UM58_9SPHI|nr:TerB family tellurite resistance protein [Mucilaginibacter segetis]MBK0378532.1 TerB family tellurite resistance protein [Mucilaginibacter segetis]